MLHHIKAFGGNPANTLLFSGFQAVGTRGRALVEGDRGGAMGPGRGMQQNQQMNSMEHDGDM